METETVLTPELNPNTGGVAQCVRAILTLGYSLGSVLIENASVVPCSSWRLGLDIEDILPAW